MAGSEISYFHRDDIAAMIKSIVQAGGNTAALVRQEIDNASQEGVHFELANLERSVDLYEQGYRDALGAVAVAFGILPE